MGTVFGDYGVTETGYVLPTVTDVEAALVAAIRASGIDPNIDLSADQPMGQINSIYASKFSELFELGETMYSGINPENAEGIVLDGVCAYTGTKRQKPTYSTVILSMVLGASASVPAGSTANVAGQPTNTWTLIGTADVTNKALLVAGPVTAVGAGTYYGWFQATETGPVAANSGTLTQITTPVTGWTSCANAADAVEGSLRETDAQLNVRREAELAAAGGSTADAMRADLLNALLVPGVVQAYVFENDSDITDGSGVPPHATHVVIYDGLVPAALNADIAAVIWADKPSGAATFGSISQTTPDSSGVQRTVHFDRAAIQAFYISPTILTDSTFDVVNGPTMVKNAYLAAWAATQNLDVEVVALKLRAAAFSVTGVVDVPVFTLDVIASPTATANLAALPLGIYTLQSSAIALTVT